MEYSIIRRDGVRVGFAENGPQGVGTLAWFLARHPAYSMDHATTHEGYSVEPVSEIDCRDVSPFLAEICAHNGVTMDSVFVPFSRSRHAVPRDGKKAWRSLNWSVTFKRNCRDILTTDYAQGEAHCPAYKSKVFRLPNGKTDSWIRDKAIALECESGLISKAGLGTPGVYSSARDRVPAPHIGDVLHSLARDSDVLDYGGFESWAAELGFDSDSRAAESTYRACVEIALKLRNGLGPTLLAEVRLLSQFN